MNVDETAAAADTLTAVRRVADAVLYEGYLLYPYRASSSKNQVRWQFGVLGPVGAEGAGVGEAPSLFTEVLLDGSGHATIDVHLRFLHTQWRAVERLEPGGTFVPVDELRVGDAQWIGWHEAVEHESVIAAVPASDLTAPSVVDIDVPAAQETELLRDLEGTVVGRLVRTRWPLAARVEITCTDGDFPRMRVNVTNTAQWEAAAALRGATGRDLAARRSLVGTHLILHARAGGFISTVDPPAGAADDARDCRNSRCWPVLAGVHDAEGAQTSQVVLAAPIILPDHPAVADESPGNLFDSTEIDEILTLRIMTLTEDEKLAARGTDPRAAAIIDRCDGMPPEVFERLHGALRGYGIDDPEAASGGESAWDSWDSVGAEPDFPTFSTPGAEPDVPWFSEAADASVTPDETSVLVDGVPVAKGSRVLLCPRRRADAHDMFLAGQVGIVARVDLDVDGDTHVAVLLEDDPAIELHEWHGRYYYFGPEELKPLPARSSSEARS